MNADSAWQPVISTERNRSIDILRGLALFGVLMVNLLTLFRIPLLEDILKPDPSPGWANHLVDVLVSYALEFKAITLFSFLFGVGVAIQIDRAGARNVSVRSFLVRRLAWLFVLGAAHLVLIWNGDILTLYAVCGMMLLPFLGLSGWALFVLGAVAICIPELVPFGSPLPSGSAATGLIALARQVYSTGTYLATLKFRWVETRYVILPLLISIVPRTTGLMFWGIAAWRSGILQEPHRHRRKLVTVLALSASVGAAITTNEVWARSFGARPWPALRYLVFLGPILLASAYATGLLLWLTPRRTSPLPRIAATGQMALTNYLVQSILFGFVFYGYGLGLFGRLGSATAACLGLGVYVAQLQLSKKWLGLFRFGPFEWLWRSLTYWRLQPFSRRIENLNSQMHGSAER